MSIDVQACNDSSQQILRATLFVFTSYLKNELAQWNLQQWATRTSSGERRCVEPVHDSLAVLHRINAPDDAEIRHLRAMETFATQHQPPEDDRLGTSRVLLVEVSSNLSEGTLQEEIRSAWCDNAGDEMCVSLRDGSQILVRNNGDVLWICEPSQSEVCVRYVLSTFRLLETMRHKILGQFNEYMAAFREPFVTAAAELKQTLELLDQTWQAEHGRSLPSSDTAGSRAVTASHDVTRAYTRTLLAQGPVQQIEAMLEANLQNLTELLRTGKHDWSGGVAVDRFEHLKMRLAQVQADLKCIASMLNAAQSVTQTFHSQMLADLAASEARENQQRDAEASQRNRHHQRLTVLGVWLGLNQVTTGWLALTDATRTWKTLTMIGFLSLPSVAIGLFWLASSARSRAGITSS